MKIKLAVPVNDGMNEVSASALWDKIEGYAAYSFNKSHSAEYSIISYWTMWLKVRYPAEFFAATMSVVDDDERLFNLVIDAKKSGLSILPPDINKSSQRIEIVGERTLYAPFQAVKGISSNVASNIVAVQKSHGKQFDSYASFEGAISVAKLGAKVNKSHREKLGRVGSYSEVETDTPSAMSDSRLKDRIELMPGFTVDMVKADRALSDEKLSKIQILSLVEETRSCEKCSLKGEPHPTPRLGGKAKFMIVFDAPSWKEGSCGKLLGSDDSAYLKLLFQEVGLKFSDGYFTTLVKSPKLTGTKALTNEQINGCSDYLKREIEILKPPVIVAMGSNSIRYFAPGVKGSPSDLAGKVIYKPDIDASVIFGINPATLHFDASKLSHIQDAIRKLSELVID